MIGLFYVVWLTNLVTTKMVFSDYLLVWVSFVIACLDDENDSFITKRLENRGKFFELVQNYCMIIFNYAIILRIINGFFIQNYLLQIILLKSFTFPFSIFYCLNIIIKIKKLDTAKIISST